MKKIKLSVAALLIASASFAQAQCEGITKQNVQCKNVVKLSKLCYLHNPNHVKKSDKATVLCKGKTKSNTNCKNKTKNNNQLCHNHTKKD